MRNLPNFLLRCSLFVFAPVAANAAGTYYTGNYQSPQTRYTAQSASYLPRAGYNAGGYSSYASTRPVGQAVSNNAQVRSDSKAVTNSRTATSKNNEMGFSLDAGISHQMANWKFEMNEAGSILHYDNLTWNVFDAAGKYVFRAGNTTMQVSAGLSYGIQSGETTMVDDDVTNGGAFVVQWCEDNDNDGKCDKVIGDQITHALSIGTSEGGSMLGFNVGFGLTDFFKWGNVRITPSVGYRYLKYKLETTKNNGLAVDSLNCFDVNGEVQCDPILVFNDGNTEFVPGRDDSNSYIKIPDGSISVDTAGTYYFYQPGTSHSYEVEWSGPYVALDVDYLINKNNSVNGRVELGLPGYNAVGDQAYRFDWAHPKSVEDNADMFGGLHLGLGANWMTALTNTVSLSIGLTYDYYNVTDADAKTYLNEGFYTGLWNTLLKDYASEEEMLEQNVIAQNIARIRNECPGWVCSSKGEVESFYKSLGIRVGINARF